MYRNDVAASGLAIVLCYRSQGVAELSDSNACNDDYDFG